MQAGHIGLETDWQAALTGCDLILHLAARIHVLHEVADDPLALYRAVLPVRLYSQG